MRANGPDYFVPLFFPAMVHADIVISFACTLRVSFNACCMIIATSFAILRLCCRCRVAQEAMANQRKQRSKASHVDSTPYVPPIIGGAQTEGQL
jgi:hypothetical protein